MKQIDLKDTAGMTISAVVEGLDGFLVLKFDGGDFASLTAEGCVIEDWPFNWSEFGEVYALEAGLIPQEVLDAKRAKEREREEQKRLRIEERERAELERLRAKYEVKS